MIFVNKIVLALPLKSINISYFKHFFVVSAIEKPRNLSFKRTRGKNETFFDEVPKTLYTVVANNYRQQKKEPENKPEPEVEVGLPPQPKEYLKYPDYDWF